MEPTTKLLNEFKCRCQESMCEPMLEEVPNDPRVIIDRCGCIFRKSHLESSIRSQLSANVLNWFNGGGEVSRFSCTNRDYIIGETYTAANVIIDRDDRYMEIWRLADQSPGHGFDELTANERFNTR